MKLAGFVPRFPPERRELPPGFDVRGEVFVEFASRPILREAQIERFGGGGLVIDRQETGEMAVVDARARFRIAKCQDLLELLGRIAFADAPGFGIHGFAAVAEELRPSGCPTCGRRSQGAREFPAPFRRDGSAIRGCYGSSLFMAERMSRTLARSAIVHDFEGFQFLHGQVERGRQGTHHRSHDGRRGRTGDGRVGVGGDLLGRKRGRDVVGCLD